jgi:Flp pilus assembly protein TadG
MLFSLLLIPLVAMIGLAVDFGHVYSVSSHTQSALDAAALAAGRAAQLNSATAVTSAQAAATNYFNQAKPQDVVSSSLQFSANSNSTAFTVTATSWVKTPFLSVLSSLAQRAVAGGAPPGCLTNGFGCVVVTTTATAALCPSTSCTGTSGGSNVEVAMMLDISGSMAGSKVASLITSAQDLVNIVVWSDQSQYYSKVALVPYSMGVNVGTYANQVRGTYSAGTSTTPGSANFQFKNPSNQTLTYPISTCVSERITHAYDDVAPSTAPLGRNYAGPTPA